MLGGWQAGWFCAHNSPAIKDKAPVMTQRVMILFI
jgi:hypothetical protein